MTTDELIQLLRTASLPRLRENLETLSWEDPVFYASLTDLLLCSQKLECRHNWETFRKSDDDQPIQRCKICGKTLLIPN